MGGLLNAIAAGPQQPNFLTPQDVQLKNAQVQQAQAQVPLTQGALTTQQQQQQVQGLNIQQMQRDLQDVATTRQFIQKHNGDFGALLKDPDYTGAVQPKTAIELQGTVLKNQDTASQVQDRIATARKTQADAEKSITEHAGNSMYAVAQQGYSVPAFFATIDQLEKTDPSAAPHLEQVRQAVTQDPTRVKEIVDGFAVHSPTRQKDFEEQTARQQAETAAARQKAEQPGQEAESGIKQHTLDMIQEATPESFMNIVDSVVPPNKGPAYETLNGRTKAHVQFLLKQGDVDGAKKLIAQAGADVTSLEKETDPSVVQSRINQAVQAEIQKAKLAPGALSGIIDPAIRNQVDSGWTAANNEYQTKVGDAQRLQSFVDAARSGNQAAAALIPIAEVREIVSRVNQQELRAAGGGVSLGRRIDNTLSNLATGKPSEATLSDVESLGKLMQGAALTTRNGKLQHFNELGAKIPLDTPAGPAPIQQSTAQPPARPSTIPANAQAQYSPSRKQWRYSTDGGKTWQTPPTQ